MLVLNQLPNPGWCSFGIDKPHAPLKQFHPSATFQISLTFQILSRKHYLWGVELLQHPMFMHSPKVDIRSDSVSHSNISELQSFPDNHWLVQGKIQKENRCAHKNLHIFSFTAFRTVWQATYLLAHCFLLCTTMRYVHQHLLPRQLFKLWEPVGRSGEAQQYGTSLFPPWR